MISLVNNVNMIRFTTGQIQYKIYKTAGIHFLYPWRRLGIFSVLSHPCST